MYFKALILKQNSRVKDLKTAIQDFYSSEKGRHKFTNITQIINWKYTWKKYSVCFNNIQLLDDNKTLSEYGILNKSELEFSRNIFRKFQNNLNIINF